ncbi:hypothetical protein HX127_09895 [Acinetobacter sp. 256-1]|uniref:hypothetical protein n=1 Tax=Acinetobacter sp. 256-1 TaxID=2746721 RepID=UPI002574F875|nr:hypothetical protein [Acinetobacter sp. 256-1]MDM1757874.1 hypothetical protein [Acinetobacter sp. 256-1]
MNQNNVEEMPVDDGMSSYDDFRNRVQEYFSNRKLTQVDIELLNAKPWKTIKEKQLCTEEIFYWLTKSEVLFSYEILEFFEQQNIHIDQLPWTPPCLRLGVSREGIIEKDIFDLLVGDNTAAVDWRWYDHKDYYEPDFPIYNDVTIKYFDQNLKFSYEIWNYPEAQFPPVYAHSTVYNEKTNAVYITGGLGTGERQCKNITEIYQLDLDTKDIQKIEALGESPPCLHYHQSEICDHVLIAMKEGNILKNGIEIKNLYVWYFNLQTKTWLAQESEQYHHWLITPVQGSRFLFRDYRILLDYAEESPDKAEEYLQHLLNNNANVADYRVYKKLYYVTDDMDCSKTEDWLHQISQCNVQGQVYHCHEGHNRLEVAFSASASAEFQNMIINDLTTKLKQISGHNVIAEKVI